MEDLTLDELLLEFNTSYFLPTKRERVIKKLVAAGKIKRLEPTGKIIKNFKTPLEAIQEKFVLAAHILNETVIVDNGTEKKVYSTCVFENVRRYNCQICIISVYGKTELIRHNCSKKHFCMKQRFTHPHENFDEHQIINIASGSKTLSMSDCYLREFLDLCQSKNVPLELIGLEYLVEVLDPRNPYYHCLLCDREAYNMFDVVDHMQSTQHRMLYLLLYFPKVYKKLSLLKKDIHLIQLSIVVRNIETKFGRVKPWRHEGALSLKQKRAIRHAIDCGPHIRDCADLSLAEDLVFNKVVKNERIRDIVFTEFVVNESVDGMMDIYERRKGEYWCKLCKITVESALEQITHPYTGRHLEHTVKGIAIYDSIACDIQALFDHFPQPLIGTEYVVEYDLQGVFNFYCMLCRKGMNNSEMVTSHLISKAHRQRYIKHHMPKKNEELLKLSGPVRIEKIDYLLKQIESKLGRLPPFGSVFSLDHKVDSLRTVKDLISDKIMDGKHFTVDDRGVPQVIYKMPVPLFPTEGEILPEAKVESKKSKKKKKSGVSLSPSPKHMRSQSPSSSDSLSPAARQRGLSPEPVPSTSYLPQEEMPLRVHNWLQIPPPDPTEMNLPDISREKVEEFVRLCDEDNWKLRDYDNHKCCPFLRATCRFQEDLGNNTYFHEVRMELTKFWLKKKLLRERGWSAEEISDLSNPKLKNIVQIMEGGPLCDNVCRPLCRSLVEAVVTCVVEDFPKADIEQMSIDEIMTGCLGLIHLSNWFHLMWTVMPTKS